MPDDIYWQDSLAWSEQQAALLQRLANGERVNADIDWEHVVEEVQDVGLSQLRAVESLLTRALEHLMKLNGWPTAQPARHWRGETLSFLLAAQRTCTASMRNRIDLADCYQSALLVFGESGYDDGPPRATPPAAVPFVLADILPHGRVAPDIDALLARLTADVARI